MKHVNIRGLFFWPALEGLNVMVFRMAAAGGYLLVLFERFNVVLRNEATRQLGN
jgi:hypothetical protein